MARSKHVDLNVLSFSIYAIVITSGAYPLTDTTPIGLACFLAFKSARHQNVISV